MTFLLVNTLLSHNNRNEHVRNQRRIHTSRTSIARFSNLHTTAALCVYTEHAIFALPKKHTHTQSIRTTLPLLYRHSLSLECAEKYSENKQIAIHLSRFLLWFIQANRTEPNQAHTSHPHSLHSVRSLGIQVTRINPLRTSNTSYQNRITNKTKSFYPQILFYPTLLENIERPCTKQIKNISCIFKSSA